MISIIRCSSNKCVLFLLFVELMCSFRSICVLFCYVVIGNLTCPNCKRSFRTPSALGQHFKDKSVCQAAWLAVSSITTKVNRTRLRISAKCAILDELVRLEEQQVPLAQSVLRVMHPHLSAKNISVWSSLRESLFLARAKGHGKLFSMVMASRVWFEKQEEKLYLAFCIRRQLFGLITDDIWLKSTMDELLVADKPPKWEEFQCSNGWVIAFKRISSQCQTNTKNVPLFKKIPLVKKFHSWLLLDLQQRDTKEEPRRCPIYGRFPARFVWLCPFIFFYSPHNCCRYMFHMDQVSIISASYY